jgi:hypothetical protein
MIVCEFKLQETDIDNYEFNSVEQFKVVRAWNLISACKSFDLQLCNTPVLIWWVIRTQVINPMANSIGAKLEYWKRQHQLKILTNQRACKQGTVLSIMTASIKFQKERWRTRQLKLRENRVWEKKLKQVTKSQNMKKIL